MVSEEVSALSELGLDHVAEDTEFVGGKIQSNLFQPEGWEGFDESTFTINGKGERA